MCIFRATVLQRFQLSTAQRALRWLLLWGCVSLEDPQCPPLYTGVGQWWQGQLWQSTHVDVCIARREKMTDAHWGSQHTVDAESMLVLTTSYCEWLCFAALSFSHQGSFWHWLDVLWGVTVTQEESPQEWGDTVTDNTRQWPYFFELWELHCPNPTTAQLIFRDLSPSPALTLSKVYQAVVFVWSRHWGAL